LIRVKLSGFIVSDIQNTFDNGAMHQYARPINSTVGAQMETISLCIIAALLIGAGCASTVLSTYVFPLSVRVRGQAHGRFAGLSAVEQDSPSGSTRKVGGPGHGGSAAAGSESNCRLIPRICT
jgi:hypothetical protein